MPEMRCANVVWTGLVCWITFELYLHCIYQIATSLHCICTAFVLHLYCILIATHCPANALAFILWVAQHRYCTTNVFWIWFAGVFCYLLSLCQLYNVQRLHIYFATHCRKAQNWAKILCNALYKNSTSKSCIWGSAVFLPEFVLYLFCICICVVSFICIFCFYLYLYLCFIFICILVWAVFSPERVWFCELWSKQCVHWRWSLVVGVWSLRIIGVI